MDIISYALGAVAAVVLIYGNVFSEGGHRDWVIWANCIGAVLFVIAGFAWYQDLVWKQDAAANVVVTPSIPRANVSFRTPVYQPFKDGQALKCDIPVKNTTDTPANFVSSGVTFHEVPNGTDILKEVHDAWDWSDKQLRSSPIPPNTIVVTHPKKRPAYEQAAHSVG